MGPKAFRDPGSVVAVSCGSPGRPQRYLARSQVRGIYGRPGRESSAHRLTHNLRNGSQASFARSDYPSGNPERSYLSRNHEGEYIELPITWYPLMGGYGEVSPGYDRPDQEDFRRFLRSYRRLTTS